MNDWIWTETRLCEARNRHSSKAGQIHNTENRPRPCVSDQINASAIPVIVEVPSLNGVRCAVRVEERQAFPT